MIETSTDQFDRNVRHTHVIVTASTSSFQEYSSSTATTITIEDKVIFPVAKSTATHFAEAKKRKAAGHNRITISKAETAPRPPPKVPEEVAVFLSKVASLANTAADEALFEVFDVFDRWFTSNKFRTCDEALATVVLDGLPDELIIGFLSASLPAKSDLLNRGSFSRRAVAVFRRRKVHPNLIKEYMGGLE